MTMPEVTPERLADDELAAIQTAWAMVEDDAQAADNWRRHTGSSKASWRTHDHAQLTRLLAHIAWLTAERDRVRQMALDYQAALDRLLVEMDNQVAPALTARDLLARLPVLHDPAVTAALAGVGEEPEEEEEDNA